MTDVLSDFIRALRANDVRISSSESIDAGAALELVGYEHRDVLKAALSQVLAKTVDEKVAFDSAFDRYFAFDQFAKPQDQDQGEAETDSDPANDNEESSDESSETSSNEPGGDQASGSGGGMGGEPRDGEGEPGDLIDMLRKADPAPLQMALASAAREAKLNEISFFTQRGLYMRRMMEIMGLDQLDRQVADAERKGDKDRLAEMMALREKLLEQVRDYVEKQLKLFTANAGRLLREDVLSRIKLGNVDHSDMKMMRLLIAKMAKKLVSLHSRRKKVTRRGMLDVRRTIRKNIEFDGLLFHTVWRKTKVDHPKVVAVCDLSGSVARVSRFLLMFLYSVQEVLPDVRSFAFSSRLGEITKLFHEKDPDDAMTEAMHLHGGGGTDYGRALLDLQALAMDDIDHRTTVLILGDARSNYGDPRPDILHKIHDRAKRVIFLNPEPRSLWNTGDSEMRKLGAHCDSVETCASLNDLKRVVSDLMRSAV